MTRAPDGWRKATVDGVELFERWHGSTRYRMEANLPEGGSCVVGVVELDDQGRERDAEAVIFGSRKGALRWVALRCRPDDCPGYRPRRGRADAVPDEA